MTKKVLIFSAFFCALISLLVPASAKAIADNCPPPHIDESVRVNYVYDGDTLQLEDGRKVRLIGIDTPEVYSRRQVIPDDVKVSGERARAALQQQLSMAKNRVGLTYGSQRFDRYGRTLAHVFLPNGRNLQAWLIAQGYAIAYTTPPNDRMSDCYRQQENRAQQKKMGIWTLPQYQLKYTHQLNEDSHGFHRIEGRVNRLWQSENRVSLLLDNQLEVRIYNTDLHNFNMYMLNALQGKTVRVRGWIRKKKQAGNQQKKVMFVMSLRHADAITEHLKTK